VGQRKGCCVATGDFTHPRWLAELRESWCRGDGSMPCARSLPGSGRRSSGCCRAPVRFMLSVEVSSITAAAIACARCTISSTPRFESAARVSSRLAASATSNPTAPDLGVDSRDLLNCSRISPDAFLILRTSDTCSRPWAAVSFDSIEDCFADLAHHIFAVETGLSSDRMNWPSAWMATHSSPAPMPFAGKTGARANLFDCDLSTLRCATRSRAWPAAWHARVFPERASTTPTATQVKCDDAGRVCGLRQDLSALWKPLTRRAGRWRAG